MNLGPVGDWNVTESFSIECRVKYNEFAGGDQNVISCESGSSGWMLRSSGNVIQFYINDGNWTGCQTSSLELNRWYRGCNLPEGRRNNFCIWMGKRLVAHLVVLYR